MTDSAAEIEEIETLHRAQLLGLGAAGLEMHQSGEMDEALLMTLAAEVAETERELEDRAPGSAGKRRPEAG
jgi:hypothetical protein